MTREEGVRRAIRSDAPANPSPGASANEFQRLLAALLEAPEDERPARLGFLLNHLRRGGAESVELISEYLASGRDLSGQTIYGSRLAGTGGGYRPGFRNLLSHTLAELANANPSLASEITGVGLRNAATMDEILKFAEIGERAAPAAMRVAAAEAAKRVLADSSRDIDLFYAVRMLAEYQMEELMPVVAQKVEEGGAQLDEFLAALWRLPEARRIDATRQLLRSDSVRTSIGNVPILAMNIDARQPEFRAAIVAGFAAEKPEQQRLYFLRSLGSEKPEILTAGGRAWEDTFPPSLVGGPGSRQQALGRLALLDQLAPYCNTPTLQLALVESRKSLQQMTREP